MSRASIALVAFASLCLFATVARADPVREAIDAANQAFIEAFLAGDAKTVSELYTEDAQVFPPGAPVARGREEIAAFWAGSMKTTKGVRLETATVESDGALAFEDGVVHLTGNDGSASSARYLVVWKRVGGRWRMQRDIWNGAAAP